MSKNRAVSIFIFPLCIIIMILFSVSDLHHAGINIIQEAEFQNQPGYQVDQLFPYPTSIKPQVEFWKKVFTRYNSSQVLIHDAFHLDRIYEVVDFHSLNQGQETSNFIKWRSVTRIKEKYIRQLNFLHRYPKGFPENSLSPFQLRLIKRLENDPSPDKYLKAAQSVRVQFGLSDRFKKAIETLGKYRPYMAEIFEKHNLPLELLVIPLYESSFVLKAMSFANAAGVWQFMPYTASQYMKLNNLVDERYDPLIATEAAAKLLTYNYKYSKSWPLAITSYNHGLYGMLDAKRTLGTDDIGAIIKNYWSPSFGFASRNFYPEFLAAHYCLKNMYDIYNNIEFEPKWQFITVTLTRSWTLASITNKLDISVDEIHEYNPSLRSPLLNSSVPLWKGFELRLPPSVKVKLASANL